MKKKMKKYTQQEWADMAANLASSMGFGDLVEDDDFLTDPEEDARKPPITVKKPGAPKGNQNARKHGLYSKIAPVRRRGDMDKALDMESLTQEAAMLRLLLAKLMENPDENLKEILQILRVLTPIVKLNLMVEDDDDSRW